ncbi:alpha/beta fold hydrolase [Oceanirhabdus seepicola]|nr:alpha/beta hydrolase [Oceanirhabdus seepicola]
MLRYRIYKKDELSEWIVFIHGLGSSSNTWVKQVRDFKQHYNLLLIDLHGHGKSKDISLKNNDNPSFKEINEDIIKVLDSLSIQSAHFMGISLGTIMVNSLTLTHPSRVKSVVMGGAVTKISLKISILLKYVLLFKLINNKFIHDMAFKITFPKEKNINKMASFSNNLKSSASFNLYYWSSIIYQINKKFKNKDYTKIPTLFIMGEEDRILIKDIIKDSVGASVFIIQNATHLCHLDSSKVFNSVALNFIGNNNGFKTREKIDFTQKLFDE